MVAIGGITRLTGSGLSITDWRPITGIFPPVTEEHWESEFSKYRGSPQHVVSFPDMTLDEFKGIYWWEYIHRVWGRLIGFLVLVPLAVFAWRGWISGSFGWKLATAVVLGGLQGALGWFMVKSGLVDRPWVSPYRLTAHLMLALFLFGYLWWLAWAVRGLPQRVGIVPERRQAWLWGFTAIFVILVVQTAWGGFMAGTKAAMSYPTFPHISGQWFPATFWTMQPAWHNPFENHAAIQFIHRWLGVTWAVAAVAISVWFARKSSGWTAQTAWLLAVLAVLQVGLGVVTLVLSRGSIPVSWGVLHQVNAVNLLAVNLFLIYRLRRMDG